MANEKEEKQESFNKTPTATARTLDADDFQFHSFSWNTNEADMCAADEVFSQGLILPSKPFIGYDSQCDSMGRYSPGVSSLGSGSSRSASTSTANSRSTSFSSRSQSLASNNFFSQPSPSPKILSSTGKRSWSRRSLSPSWGLFRVGLVKPPEIEMDDLRLRKMKQRVGRPGDHCYEKVSAGTSGGEKAKKKKAGCFGSGRLGCKHSGDVVESISSLVLASRKDETVRLKSDDVICTNPAFEWLNDLCIEKVSIRV